MEHSPPRLRNGFPGLSQSLPLKVEKKGSHTRSLARRAALCLSFSRSLARRTPVRPRSLAASSPPSRPFVRRPSGGGLRFRFVPRPPSTPWVVPRSYILRRGADGLASGERQQAEAGAAIEGRRARLLGASELYAAGRESRCKFYP